MISRTLLAFIVGSALVGNASVQRQTRSSAPLPLAQAAATPSDCPDLSGQYVMQGEDGQVRISIGQQRCLSISIVRRRSYLSTVASETHTLTLDGKVRRDSMWFGGSDECCDTSATFVGPTLTIEA